jgi:hypothetical protein
VGFGSVTFVASAAPKFAPPAPDHLVQRGNAYGRTP